MSSPDAAPARSQALVVCVCIAPLLAEGLAASLERIADVRWLPAGRSSLVSLLRALAPDVVVVEVDTDADAAQPFADETGVLIVQLSSSRECIRLRRGGRWETPDGIGPELVRDVIASTLLGRSLR